MWEKVFRKCDDSVDWFEGYNTGALSPEHVPRIRVYTFTSLQPEA